MSAILNINQRNAVLNSMVGWIEKKRTALLEANNKDLETYVGNDIAMYDRLKIDDDKIKGMMKSLKELALAEDPLNVERFQFAHENGLHISNRTAPFGTILIIYESRPDVTIEAAGIAFKSGNNILLKGGKESLNSNLVLVDLWHRALTDHSVPKDWVTYLRYNRKETQVFLENPSQRLDLIVPRGGERLISFVKKHATCPVIVSGRGNNFVYVDLEADLEMALEVIINAKTSKISACNALDKVLINSGLKNKDEFLKKLISRLQINNVEILTDGKLGDFKGTSKMKEEAVWHEEFLDYKILMGEVNNLEEAIEKINLYGGGHSAAIITTNEKTASFFMHSVDSAAVYHNASTRFTDGGQFGLGGELAISTDKLHQRGPIGLQHLVTNKWFVKGNGQIR